MSARPSRFDIPSAWTGASMSGQTTRWQQRFSDLQIAELESAAERVLSTGQPPADITAEDFSLPTLAAALLQTRHTLMHGQGFTLWRGLPVERYTAEEVAVIYFGLGAHIGQARMQNARGHLLGHVRDAGLDPGNPNTRIYQTTARQTFHTDSTDVVGLLCLKEAAQGGESMLVSAVTLYNELSAISPKLMEALFLPIATDRRGEVPAGHNPWFEIPVLNWYAGFLTCLYHRVYINSASRFPDAPTLNATQVEALNRFDELANNPQLHLNMQLEPGDIQFVYNHHLLHDRMAFTDHETADKRRHLLRLWLSLPDDRPLPESYRQRYGAIESGCRGGLFTQSSGTPVQPCLPFYPEH